MKPQDIVSMLPPSKFTMCRVACFMLSKGLHKLISYDVKFMSLKFKSVCGE